MSQVFQVIDGIVHWKTPYATKASIPKDHYPPKVMAQFVETSDDSVREGWGYVSGEFVRPTPPEGWLYNDSTGTFYKQGTEPVKLITPEQQISLLLTDNKKLQAQTTAQSQTISALEDCIVELATILYA